MKSHSSTVDKLLIYGNASPQCDRCGASYPKSGRQSGICFTCERRWKSLVCMSTNSAICFLLGRLCCHMCGGMSKRSFDYARTRESALLRTRLPYLTLKYLTPHSLTHHSSHSAPAQCLTRFAHAETARSSDSRGSHNSSIGKYYSESMSDNTREGLHTSAKQAANPTICPTSIFVHRTIVDHHRPYCVFSTHHHHTLHEAI